MTDTTDHTEVETADAPVAIEAPIDPRVVENRLLLPLLLPVLAIVGVAFLAINISRVFLAGSSTVALVIAAIITVVILMGASLLSAAPRLRSGPMTMLLSTFVLVVMAGGLLTLGPSLSSGHEGEATGWQEPTDPATGTLEVEALASTRFDKSEYTTPAGIIEIDYLCSNCGDHTLAFTDPEFNGFLLHVPPGPLKKKVDLKPGSYEIYCTIPGHRALGMDATIVVT